ncbi:hypothetical protein [Streptomyces luteolus]|uniref:Secreted protein n=1 Tax=Streptomyces luteolus TaxID=3043615 RepID=A0ABT6T7G6_9ACTN|nr:hypothetical protein [Streptomyces sp. B-S-A12]MDI3423810.1 hypothetical protein [Streptomyces sp. B-S-A12]
MIVLPLTRLGKREGTNVKSLKKRRVLAAMGLAIAAGVTPVATASPAAADIPSCLFYLEDRGYVVGKGVTSACRTGSNPTEFRACYKKLTSLGVRSAHADTACALAGR